MRVVMLTKYSPVKGKMLQAGQVVDVPDEVAADLLQRGLATPARPVVEHAVAPGQEAS
jgi:hypothetical protein